MAEQTTANIRIVLEDASPGGDATSAGGSSSEQRHAGKATEEATRRPADQGDVSKTVADIRQQHQKTVTENLKRNLKQTGRQWWQIGRAARGVLRGTAFAQQGTMASAGTAAYEFGSAGSAMAQFFGGGSGIGATIGTIGAVAGTAATAIGGLAMAAKASSDALLGMAERHRSFSGVVSKAHAEAGVERTMFEINQAARYGEQEAKALKLRNELGIEWDTMMDKLKSDAGKLFSPLIEGFKNFLRDFNEYRGLHAKQAEQDVDGMKLLARMANAFEQFAGSGHPGEAWMKNTPHLELKDANVGVAGFDALDEQRVGGLNPFHEDFMLDRGL